MGLQNQLTDVSSESIPILLLLLIANCVRYLRSLLFTILHSLGLCRFNHANDNNLPPTLLAEQLNLNRFFSRPYTTGNRDEAASDCVVCLNRFNKGDPVRKLACRHVFHKECFDGWLDHLNFNCPLCRSHLLSDERVILTERRVDDLLTWFSWR